MEFPHLHTCLSLTLREQRVGEPGQRSLGRDGADPARPQWALSSSRSIQGAPGSGL